MFHGVFGLSYLHFVMALHWCGSESTACDLITLTGKSWDTRQTHVTGMG